MYLSVLCHYLIWKLIHPIPQCQLFDRSFPKKPRSLLLRCKKFKNFSLPEKLYKRHSSSKINTSQRLC